MERMTRGFQLFPLPFHLHRSGHNAGEFHDNYSAVISIDGPWSEETLYLSLCQGTKGKRLGLA